ncbi:MAG: general secretion pathway protein GspK [Candidatus Omnitrophica bacterium]|nr:general secretion pathway protein GspK [Candidatus Omnitrophota bacterium]
MNKKGTILILTLAFLALLSMNAIYFTYFARLRTKIWENQIAYYKAYYFAMTGIDVGKKLLSESKNNYLFLRKLLSNQHYIYTKDGTIKIKIYDMDSQININSLITKKGKSNTRMLTLYKNLLINLGLSTDLSDVLLDWIDPNGIPRVFGAGPEYYQQLTPPYVPSDGPILSTEQLYLLKGYTKKVLLGTKTRPGLLNFVTTDSDSKINVNTADPLILKSLGYSDDEVNRILSEREVTPLELGYLLNLDRNVTLAGQGIISTDSHFYKIVSTGYVGKAEKTVSFIVKTK